MPASRLPKPSAASVLRELRSIGDPDIAAHSQRFFKTGKGEYGEGDRFLGIRVPRLRRLAKTHAHALDADAVLKLLHSKYHEARLLAVIVWTLQFKRAAAPERRAIYRAYLGHTEPINNWDIVDASAHLIVGPQIEVDPSVPGKLRQLSRSSNLWERRISMMATYHEIKQERFALALDIAERLVDDEHDLIHKCVGWMLREIGKRDRAVELAFLDRHAPTMPRTMLRYAIEKLSAADRRDYLTRRSPAAKSPLA
ncbi:MAG: DNA alkylation repair protein [Myxococcales bacterium FL481]|nr:MAG: DNA alkylation repair protein [Myxococcales bacterium FL481]